MASEMKPLRDAFNEWLAHDLKIDPALIRDLIDAGDPLTLRLLQAYIAGATHPL